MATHKNKRIFLGVFLSLVLLSACHTVTQDELSGTGLAPDPVFNPSRSFVIIPVSVPEGEDRVRFVWASSLIDNVVFNYLQFAQSIPGNLSNIIVDNASDIWDFYGAENPSIHKQIELLKKTVDDNKSHWLTILPEKKEDILTRYAVPNRLSLNIVRGKETPLHYFDQKMIVVQSRLDRNRNFTLSVYDSLSSKTLSEIKISLNFTEELGTMAEQEKIRKALSVPLKKLLEEITQQKMIQVSIPPISKDIGVYVEGKLSLEDSLLLSQGKHRIYVSQMGRILMQGTIDVQKDGELDIQQALEQQKGTPLVIETNPSHAPLFIGERYVGLSPTRVILPSGEYYLRTTLPGHSHINYILQMDAKHPLKTISLDLSLVDKAYMDRVDKLRNAKLGTFFSGILGIGATLYSFERMTFYQSKITQGVDLSRSNRRYNQFLAATVGFGTLSAGLIVTAAILQLLEYQARDFGIGVSEDGNLGVVYNF